MERLPHKYYLTEEQRQFFDENGYLIIKKLIDDDTLSTIRQRFADVCNKKVPKDAMAIVKDYELTKQKQKPEDYVNKLNFLTHDPVFARYTEHPRLLHVVSQIIGDSITVFNSMMINKPPGTKWHPPHQDVFHIPVRPFDKVVSTWTAIDPVSTDNGCLFIMPGSHKPRKLHEQVHIPSLVNRLFYMIPEVDEVAAETKRYNVAPLEPGDTVLIHALLVHGSWPNHSNTYRKAITNIYASNECRFIDVRGTVQESFEQGINNQIKAQYGDGQHITLEEFWKQKCKHVHGLKSNL